MRVAFRVDASSRIGTGHLTRCLTLADALKRRGAYTRFVCRNLSSLLQIQLIQKEHEIVLLNGNVEKDFVNDLAHSHWLGVDQIEDAHDTMRALSDRKWDWVIVDHYALDERWETVIRHFIQNILVIDDIADRRHDCDVLLDQNYLSNMDTRYIGRVPEGCKLFLGPQYALLHPSYAKMHSVIEPRTKVKRILIFFGGSDPDNLTGRAIEAFLSLDRNDIDVDIVLPIDFSYFTELKQFASDCGSPLKYHKNLPTLAPLIASTDLAIGAVGATTWERLCLGLPTIAVTRAENQLGVCAALQREGLIVWVGHAETVTAEEIAIKLREILNADNHCLAAWSAKCREMCDGLGANRIIANVYAS